MALAEGQIQISRTGGASITLHHGTPYRVNGFNPLDRSTRAAQTGSIAWGDGDWSGAEWRAGTVVPMRIGIHGATWAELMELYWALDAALSPVRTGPEVEVQWMAGGVEYLMYGRPRRCHLEHKNLRIGIGWATAEIACPDPAIYSAAEYSTTLGLLYRTGGLVTPFTTPFTFYSVVADGEVELTNAGTAPARLLLTITGPVTRPRITLVGDSGPQTLYLDTVLEDGDVLEIDTAARLVVLNSTTSRLRDAYGTWPLLSGTALLRFEADSYNDQAQLVVRHRDTY